MPTFLKTSICALVSRINLTLRLIVVTACSNCSATGYDVSGKQPTASSNYINSTSSAFNTAVLLLNHNSYQSPNGTIQLQSTQTKQNFQVTLLHHSSPQH